MKGIEQLSLGWRTHLMFPRFDAQVLPQADHITVRTPHNPGFWWGNFLLYDRAPREGDAAAWIAAFDAEIGQQQPESAHCTFGIEGPADFALPADFAAAGFTKERSTILVLQPDMLDPALPPLPRDLRVRVAELPGRTPELLDLQVATDEGAHPVDGYRLFRERQMQRYAAMQDAGLGHWFGVFARTPQGEQLVADCGLFRPRRGGGGTARFQNVGTHPDWRRRGIATALVHAVCRHGFRVMRDDTLVIAADPLNPAIRLYEAIGFEHDHDIATLVRKPPAAAA